MLSAPRFLESFVVCLPGLVQGGLPAQFLNQVIVGVEDFEREKFGIPGRFWASPEVPSATKLKPIVSSRTTAKASRQNCRWRVLY
jgi:hypothetical protein